MGIDRAPAAQPQSEPSRSRYAGKTITAKTSPASKEADDKARYALLPSRKNPIKLSKSEIKGMSTKFLEYMMAER